MATKLRLVRAELIEAGSAVELEDALTAFFAGAGESELLEAHFQVDAGHYTVLVLYTGNSGLQ